MIELDFSDSVNMELFSRKSCQLLPIFPSQEMCISGKQSVQHRIARHMSTDEDPSGSNDMDCLLQYRLLAGRLDSPARRTYVAYPGSWMIYVSPR